MQYNKSVKKEKNIFTSKSNVLKFLTTKITKSKIESIYDFTISDWKNNESEIISNISKFFPSPIVIRSSAIGEDSKEDSGAGIYESVLNVNPNSKNSIKNGIKKVIHSYEQKRNLNPKNQILIQNQSRNILISGVIFTRSPDDGSPYYVINYEESGSTIGVTQGTINNSIKIFRSTRSSNLPKKWQILINSIKEIESLLKTSSLDIEFGITKSKKVIIFQVRPIVSINSISQTSDKKTKNLLMGIKAKYDQLINSNRLLGKFTIYSDMTDWNPAEIIGNNPNPLDYSLYEYLIMKNAWYQGRTNIGYQNLDYNNLMVKFGNKPYVDVRKSFNSLIPANVEQKIASKLMEYYIKKLSENPDLHDKVEFEILFTCFDLLTDLRLNDLRKHNFSQKEIIDSKISLIEFTNKIIQNFDNISEQCNRSIKKMTENRTKILSQINTSKKKYDALLFAVEQLLCDCKKYGTIPFSSMARIAFIASAILKSLVKRKYLTQEFVDGFMSSIHTPLSEFRETLIDYSDKKIPKKDVLKKYGHLRPGTYDINANRYDAQNDFLENIKFKKTQKTMPKFEKTNVSAILGKNQFHFEKIDFFTFLKKSLQSREILKFEFSHNLSDSLELISEAGENLGFSRKEISFLDINYILSTYKKYKRTELKKRWKKKIELEKRKKIINNSLKLPPMICSKEDFEIISYYKAKPNFITSQSITSNIKNLKGSQNTKIENKIVLLESADPGYDWIFTKNPTGLITKYGGVASHMAIRCAEIGLPAAIGCGELLFEQLLRSTKILLDCKNEKIIILENKKINDYVEERKLLKSLGYIK